MKSIMEAYERRKSLFAQGSEEVQIFFESDYSGDCDLVAPVDSTEERPTERLDGQLVKICGSVVLKSAD